MRITVVENIRDYGNPILKLSRRTGVGRSWPAPVGGNCSRVENEMREHAERTPVGEIFTIWGELMEMGGYEPRRRFKQQYVFVD